MIKSIKKLLFNVLPQKTYLRTLHRGFYFLYNLGLLKGKPAFKYHYMVQKLILPEYTVVDIGANLGYFSRNFSILAHHGQVVSIEPIPVFYEVLNQFIGKRSNVTIHNVALGKEQGVLEMVMPVSDGMIRTGLPHIRGEHEDVTGQKVVEVKIVKGSELFGALAKIDYLKCDIEGYERVVFEEIEPVIDLKRPIVQLEVAQENEAFFLNYFATKDYVQFGIQNDQLIEEKGKQAEHGDYLFVPKEQKDSVIARCK